MHSHSVPNHITTSGCCGRRCLGSTLIALLIYRAGALAGAVLGWAATVTVIALSWYAFSQLGWLADPIYPVLAPPALPAA